MVPTDFANYFLATAGAGAALIGLLFVAISINPERTFGRDAQPVRQRVASSAFTALVNAFFISTSALIPHTNVGYITLIMGGIGLLNSLRLAGEFLVGYWRSSLASRLPWPVALRALAFVAVSLILYGYEVVLAVLLLIQPDAVGFVYTLTGILLGIYGLGLVRAWELLGAPRSSLVGWFNPLHESPETPTEKQPPGA
ncbi:MAG TPA: hypothetical protein VGF38_10180 [Ktedonobacterales bacterium]